MHHPAPAPKAGRCPSCGQAWGEEKDERCRDVYHYDDPQKTLDLTAPALKEAK